MRRLWLFIAALLAVILVVALLHQTGRLDSLLGKEPRSESKVVGPQGGSFTFPDGIAVTVPNGAVDGEVELSVTTPQTLKADDPGPFAGLRSGGLQLDVSLTKSDGTTVQPKAPLMLRLPVEIPEAGHGARMLALPYTPDPGGEHYMLLPSSVEGQVMEISLLHLSPKYVAYVSDQKLLDSFFPERVKEDRRECKQEATVSGRKVKIGGDSRGWSLEDDSAIHACLMLGEDGSVQIGVANRIDYMLTVAATRDTQVATSRGSFDEELAKYLLGFVNDDNVKGYVPRDGELVGSVNPNDLPATIEIRAQIRTFAAESTVRILALVIGVITGKGNLDESLALLGTLFEVGGLVECLGSTLRTLPEDGLDLGQMVGVVGECFGPLATALAQHFNVLEVWGRIALAADALKAIVETVISSYNGVKLQFNDTIRVQVVGEAPPLGDCPTLAQIEQALHTDTHMWHKAPQPIAEVRIEGDLVCQDQWASTQVGVRYADSQGPNDLVGFSVVLNVQDGRWAIAGSGQDMTGDPVCGRAPDVVISNVYCG